MIYRIARSMQEIARLVNLTMFWNQLNSSVVTMPRIPAAKNALLS